MALGVETAGRLRSHVDHRVSAISRALRILTGSAASGGLFNITVLFTYCLQPTAFANQQSRCQRFFSPLTLTPDSAFCFEKKTISLMQNLMVVSTLCHSLIHLCTESTMRE